MSRRNALNPSVKRSLRYSLRDGAAFGVMSGAGESYFSAFALYFKATSQEVAWLAALPPLIGSWMQLVSAWIGRSGRHRKRLIIAGTLSQALLWLPLMMLPLAFPDQAPALLIVCVVLFHVSGNLVQPQWSSLMGDLVPERRRGRYFARRNRLASLATLLSLIGAGIILHALTAQGQALMGFLAVFAIASSARLLSSYYLSRMYDPEEEAPPALPNGPHGLSWLRALRGTPFLRFSVAIAALQGSVAIAAPFFAVYMLRHLDFSYLQFMIITASSTVMQLLTLNTWGQIGDRLGNRVMLVTTGWLVAVLPALWLVSDNFWYLMGIQLLSGLGWGGFNLSAGNYLYDLRPGRPLAAYMAVHNVLTSAAVFVGAACGGYLAVHLPTEVTLGGQAFAWDHALFGVFAISTAARLAVVTALLTPLAEVRLCAQASTRTLIFRMARLNTVTGMVMDIVGVIRNGGSSRQLEPAALGTLQTRYQPPPVQRIAGERVQDLGGGSAAQTPAAMTKKRPQMVEQEA